MVSAKHHSRKNKKSVLEDFELAAGKNRRHHVGKADQ
jgi:hypothetical protein